MQLEGRALLVFGIAAIGASVDDCKSENIFSILHTAALRLQRHVGKHIRTLHFSKDVQHIVDGSSFSVY